MAGIKIPIEVVDKFSRQLNDLDKKMGTVAKSAQKQSSIFDLLGKSIVSGLSVSAVIAFGRASLDAFSQSEKSIVRLDQALKNQGFTSKQYRDTLMDQAAALQRVTAFSDEAVRETQTLLTTFGMAGAQLRDTTKAALDLSTGLGIDLRSATMLLGKAFAGETGALGRYGIKIDETKVGAEKFAEVMRQVQARFGGSAQAEAQSYAGKLAILTNQFDELKEAIGSRLVPVVSAYAGWLNQIAQATNTYLAARDEANRTDKTAIEKLSEFRDKLLVVTGADEERAKVLEKSGNIGAASAIRLSVEYTSLIAKVRELNAEIASGTPNIKAVTDPISKPPVDAALADKASADAMKLASEQLHLQQSAQQQLDSATLTHAELYQQETSAQASRMTLVLGGAAAERFEKARERAFDKATNQQKIQDFSSTMSAISTLSSSKNKQLAAIGKAAAIANIWMSTYTGVAKAWSMGPILGPILAPIVLIAGAAQAAAVAGLALREGGLVNGSRGGIQATIGEDGRSEAVIPLENSGAMRRIGEAISNASGGRGGGTSIYLVHLRRQHRGRKASLPLEVLYQPRFHLRRQHRRRGKAPPLRHGPDGAVGVG